MSPAEIKSTGVELPREVIQLGDIVQCEFCEREKIVAYMYGNKHPMCNDCAKVILS